MPYTKAISPVSNSYLTKGKEYDILKFDGDKDELLGYGFKINDDTGRDRYITEHPVFNYRESWQLK